MAISLFMGALAQAVQAKTVVGRHPRRLDLGTELYRRRAQRYNPNRKAEVAQLVEQLIRNQQVVGSSPTFGSNKLNINNKLKAI